MARGESEDQINRLGRLDRLGEPIPAPINIETNLLKKILICLERIAYCSTPTNLELDAFKEIVLYANSGSLGSLTATAGSTVQVQKGNKDKVSISKWASPGSKKHDYRSNTYPHGVRVGQEEETDEEVLTQVP